MKRILVIVTAILLFNSISAIAQTQSPPERKSPAARRLAGCDEPPAERIVFLSLFELVGFVTGPPFNFFPALGGADKTKFVNDDLIL